MLKITSFTALIIGLIIAAPMIFSDAEASRGAPASAVVTKADRESTDSRIANAFRLVDLCSPQASGDAAAWCAARQTNLLALNSNGSLATVTVEIRDEANQTSVLAVLPAGGI